MYAPCTRHKLYNAIEPNPFIPPAENDGKSYKDKTMYNQNLIPKATGWDEFKYKLHMEK